MVCSALRTTAFGLPLLRGLSYEPDPPGEERDTQTSEQVRRSRKRRGRHPELGKGVWWSSQSRGNEVPRKEVVLS